MNRTPFFTSLFWTSVAAAAVAGCETEEPKFISAEGPAALVPSNVEFSVTCGAEDLPDPVRFQIVNSGNEVLQVSSATATNGFVVAGELPVEVQPGAAVTLEVRAPRAEIGTDVGGTTKTGKLTLKTNDPNGDPEISLRSAIHGANLVLVDSEGMPLPKVDFRGESSSTCPAPVAVFLKNTGDAEVEVALGEVDFPITQVNGTSAIGAGEQIEFEVSPLVGSECLTGGQILYQVTGDTCSAAPILQVTQQVGGTSSCFCGGSSSAV